MLADERSLHRILVRTWEVTAIPPYAALIDSHIFRVVSFVGSHDEVNEALIRSPLHTSVCARKFKNLTSVDSVTHTEDKVS